MKPVDIACCVWGMLYCSGMAIVFVPRNNNSSALAMASDAIGMAGSIIGMVGFSKLIASI